MTDEERLAEIKKQSDRGFVGSNDRAAYLASEDIVWLISRAERCQELEAKKPGPTQSNG